MTLTKCHPASRVRGVGVLVVVRRASQLLVVELGRAVPGGFEVRFGETHGF